MINSILNAILKTNLGIKIQVKNKDLTTFWDTIVQSMERTSKKTIFLMPRLWSHIIGFVPGLYRFALK